MIGSFYRVLFLAVLGLAGTWAGFLFLPEMARKTMAGDDAWYAESFSTRLIPKEKSRVEPSSTLFETLVPDSLSSFRSARELIARRMAVSRDLLPFWVVFFLISILGGSLFRERLHGGTAYASPTVSFLSKRSGEAALLVFFLWSFAPIPLPYWVFYPALTTTMIATIGYVANLPLRI